MLDVFSLSRHGELKAVEDVLIEMDTAKLQCELGYLPSNHLAYQERSAADELNDADELMRHPGDQKHWTKYHVARSTP